VTNIAANLNGQPPIQVFVRPTTERHVRIHSIDLGLSETITTIAGIQDFRNPASPFALPKAALCLLGLVGQDEADGSIDARLEEVGSGMEITLLSAVPKGSGLGTSSILGGVILAALQRFFALPTSLDDLYLQVLEMEQMLTTGGGWQDQIGGLAGGVKFIESKHGLKPAPVVYQLDPWLFENGAPTSCMTLFYTGVTRLAKNILQEVVDQVNDNTPAYIFTHDYLKELAATARVAIARRDLATVAEVIAGSWNANKLIHPSTTNDEVEAIIQATRQHFRGMKLLGAGGGGFALFISETPQDADHLRGILTREFENDRARIVDFSLNKVGLEVTVS
jgi:galactokinase/mevalonate kinase-like predicted kinase